MMRRAAVNGTWLAYREAGDGPLLLLVHGFPLDHRVWLDQLEALSSRCRCVAVDLRGFGASGPPVEPLSMEVMADDLAALIEVLGEEGAHVAGLSMGGYVALALWERHRDVVRSLALVDTRAEADSPQGRARRDELAEQAVTKGLPWLAESMTASLLAPGTSLRARARLRSMVEGVRYETVVAALAGMRDRADRRSLLSGIEVPVLVVVGDRDQVTPPASAREMAEAVPDGRLVVVEDAGHLTPLEAADRVSRALGSLLDQ